MKNYSKLSLTILGFFVCFLSYGQEDGASSNERRGFVQDNLVIDIGNYQDALIRISNKQVVIDGYWEFKDETGQVLEEPIILSQPAGLNDKLLLALRRPGSADVVVTEGGQSITYKVVVDARFEENTIEKELESAITQFVGDAGVKVTVLPPQASLVGANLNRSFGQETASEILAPRGETAGSASGELVGADDFRPTIMLEGEVATDSIAMKAESIARAYTNNVINMLSIKNPMQIRINIKVIQVTQTLDSRIGVQHSFADNNPLGGTGGPTSPTGLGLAFNSTAPFFETGNSSALPIFGTPVSTLSGGNYQTNVNLAKLGVDIEVLQEPTLTVLNGQAAEFIVGQSVFVPTGFTIEDGVVTQLFEERELGISLRITPLIEEEEVFREDAQTGGIPVSTINVQKAGSERDDANDNSDNIITTIDSNGVMRFFIQPQITSLAGFDTNGFAQIDTNRVETRVAIRHNESLVLGGLFDREKRKQLEEVPFISKIPILGELFKDRLTDNEVSELIFVLTPRIVNLWDVEQKGTIYGREDRMNELLVEEGLQAKPTRISANDVRVRGSSINYGPGGPLPVEENLSFISTSAEPLVFDQESYEQMKEDPNSVTLEPVDPNANQEQVPPVIQTEGNEADVTPRPVLEQ
ncbi:MAG: hypothetical protein AAF558_08035 [Verrucomicrobiota bacterium]